MTKIYETQPENLNNLSPVSCRLAFNSLPNVVYRTTSVPLPGLQLGETEQASPLQSIPWPGTELIQEPLAVSFIVDEDLVNWKEIFDWMIGLGSPKSTEQYKNQADNTYRPHFGGYFSDATLIIYTNEGNKNLEVKFRDCFPNDLTAIDFDSGSPDITTMVATAMFKYTYYEFVE